MHGSMLGFGCHRRDLGRLSDSASKSASTLDHGSCFVTGLGSGRAALGESLIASPPVGESLGRSTSTAGSRFKCIDRHEARLSSVSSASSAGPLSNNRRRAREYKALSEEESTRSVAGIRRLWTMDASSSGGLKA